MVMLSMVLLTGYGGFVSLAQIVFAGVGALAYAKLDEPNLYGLVLSALIAAGVGALVALPVLRLTGLYLALATFAFGVLMEKMVFQQDFAFGFNGTLPADRLSLLGNPIESLSGYVFVMAVFLLLMGVAVLYLRRGVLGRLLIAMRDSPAACGTLGLDMRWFRVGLFALSAGLAGAAGGLYAGLRGTVGAAEFGYFNSLLLLLFAVVFGLTSVTGAVLGGTGLMLLPVLQSEKPELAGLMFVIVGAGAIFAAREPNGLSILIFKLGQLIQRRVLAGLPSLPSRPTGGSDDTEHDEWDSEDLDGDGGGRHAADPDRHHVGEPDASNGHVAEPVPAPAAPLSPRRSPVSLLEVHDVVVQFGGVIAVNEASFAAEQGRVTGSDRPQRCRQDDLLQRHQRAADGPTRAASTSTARASPRRPSTVAPNEGWAAPSSVSRRSARSRCATTCASPTTSTAASRASCDPAASDVDALLERVGISAYAQERADSIPTGTARLLELARCLASDPKLLLLDEPSSGLDESETDDFGDLLKDLAAEGRGVLMVEHDMDLVMAVCDEIHVLDFGRVIASGGPADGPQRPGGAEGLPRLLRRGARARAGRGRRGPLRGDPGHPGRPGRQ